MTSRGLLSFKAAIRSDDSGRLEKWIGYGCCKWEGISCNNTTGRVTQINLPGFFTSSDDSPVQTSMNGHLSPSITLLSSLEVIDLSWTHWPNWLYSSIDRFSSPKTPKTFSLRE
ncbi:Leucine-rich repeat (LRR) family protein [Abeliophyllum distichum]|uniref:Leucine-rich repeat (LRR) family protein n=1 Tax=Abeliophyllum distichum TaxID=126358 RepID=A0ABD1U390_9LAMI